MANEIGGAYTEISQVQLFPWNRHDLNTGSKYKSHIKFKFKLRGRIMYLVSQVSSAPLQTQTLILPDGSSTTLTMAFYPQQYCWVITLLTWKTFTLSGLQITTSPNMLNQWKNQLSFGLGCTCVNNREPTQQQDFSSVNAQLWILSAAEVAQYARILGGALS